MGEGSRRRWYVSTTEARRVQEALRERLVLSPPPGFEPRLVAGADVSTRRFGHRGFAGIVVLDAASHEMVAEASAALELRFPYVPGLLSFRELPPLAMAWERLAVRPDVLIFDGHGTAHPRGFGLACHGGVLFDTPSIGCAKSLLVGSYAGLGEERGATAELVHEGKVVGMAVRTRARVKPVYVSAGHLMDLRTAVDLVLRVSRRFREPETTRRAHALVNRLRQEEEQSGRPREA